MLSGSERYLKRNNKGRKDYAVIGACLKLSLDELN